MREHWGVKQNLASGKLARSEQENHGGESNIAPTHTDALVRVRRLAGEPDLDEWNLFALLVCRDAADLLEARHGTATYEVVAVLVVYADFLDVVNTVESRRLRATAHRYARALDLRHPTHTQRATAFLHRAMLRRRAAGRTP